MNAKEQKVNYLKRILIASALSLILIICIIGLKILQNNIGLNYTNKTINYCSNIYLTLKYSNYLKQIYITQFIIANLASLLCLINLIFCILYFLKLRKEQNILQKGIMDLTINKIRIHIATNFIIKTFIISILFRNLLFLIQIIKCQSMLELIYLALTLIALLSLIFLIICSIFWTKLLYLLQKQQSLSDDENNILNALNKKNQQTRSNDINRKMLNQMTEQKDSNQSQTKSLRTKLLKKGEKQDQNNIYNVYKNIYGQNSDSQQQQDNQNDQVNDDEEQKERSKFQALKTPIQNLRKNPNKQQIKKNSLSTNVLSLRFNKDIILDESRLQQFNKNPKKSQNKQQKDNDFYNISQNKNDHNKMYKMNQQKKLANKILIQLQTKIAPNSQIKKKICKAKNPQNIDQNGKFYYFDEQKLNKIKNSKNQYDQELKSELNEQQYNPLNFIAKQIAQKPSRKLHDHQTSLIQAYEQIWEQKLQQIDLYKNDQRYIHNGNLSQYQSGGSQSQEFNSQQQYEDEDEQNSEQDGKQIETKKIQLIQAKISPPQIYLHLHKKQQKLNPNRLRLFQQDQLYNEAFSQIDEYNQQNQVVIAQRQDQNSSEYNKRISQTKKKKKKKRKIEEEEQLRFQKKLTKQQKILKFIKSKYAQTQQQKRLQIQQKMKRQKTSIQEQQQSINYSNQINQIDN